ncbi:MAG: YybH family protein [Actinomycetota bacterium]|nr:nuclear transport factor 2 family protein [Actinomycetota bacterium]
MSNDELLRRNDDWERAIMDRDAAAAKSVLADDYALVLVQPVPVVMGIDEWIALLPDYVVHEWRVEERVVHALGDLAAILQRVSMRATVSGSDRSGLFVISDVWRRSNGEWRVWRRHSTPLSAGELGPAARPG